MNVPGVREETVALRYKVNGSAGMTEKSMVRTLGVIGAGW